jgi:2-isopropylmalate synthase
VSERQQVAIFDTTLRDGEQSPGCSMNRDEKLRMAAQLDRLGVDVIEAGFPVASEGEFQAVQAVARQIRRPVVAALARSCRQDVERAWQALEAAAHPRIHIFLATSDIHLQHKLKISRQQCLDQACDAVRFAKSLCQDVEFSPEDATRSDPDFLCEVAAAVIDAGATTLNIPDTVGYTVPSEFAGLIQTLRARVRGIDRGCISVHCHDDLGLAVANSLAAVAAGARQVECTINGIGERAGNASLEEIVMAMRVRRDRYPYDTVVISEQLCPTSQLLSRITGVPVPPNKAVIGRNAFAHEAGIHQHGVITNPLTYEIMTPQSVGAAGTRLVLGKHSGRHAVGLRCAQLGFKLGPRELEDIYRDFGALADRVRTVEDWHLLELISKAHVPASDSSSSADGSEGRFATYPGNGNGRSRPSPVAVSQRENENPRPNGAPFAVRAESEHEQDDYLWGV